jgi:uncharacterized membrane protein YfcA
VGVCQRDSAPAGQSLIMEFVAALGIIFVGAVVQSSIGFGLAIIAAPLLFVISPDYVPGPITSVALVLSIMLALQYRKNLSLDGLGAAIAGRVPGSLAGGALLMWADVRVISLWIGISVLLAVVISLSRLKVSPTPARMAFAGFMSGLMGTSTSIGGPPLALLLQHEAASVMRANLSAFFIVSCVLSLMVLVPAGYMGWKQLMLALPLLPAAMLGHWVAVRYSHRLPQDLVRYLSLAICAICGVMAVANYWL